MNFGPNYFVKHSIFYEAGVNKYQKKTVWKLKMFQ